MRGADDRWSPEPLPVWGTGSGMGLLSHKGELGVGWGGNKSSKLVLIILNVRLLMLTLLFNTSRHTRGEQM